MTPPQTTENEKPPPTLDERVTALETAMQTNQERLNEGSETMQQIQADLASNTQTTKDTKEDTSEIVEFFRSVKGAFKVLNWLGNLAKPVGAIIAFFVAGWSAWMAFKNGGPPA